MEIEITDKKKKEKKIVLKSSNIRVLRKTSILQKIHDNYLRV